MSHSIVNEHKDRNPAGRKEGEGGGKANVYGVYMAEWRIHEGSVSGDVLTVMTPDVRHGWRGDARQGDMSVRMYGCGDLSFLASKGECNWLL